MVVLPPSSPRRARAELTVSTASPGSMPARRKFSTSFPAWALSRLAPAPEPMPSHRSRKSIPSSRRNQMPVSPLTASPCRGAPARETVARNGSDWAKSKRPFRTCPSRRGVPKISSSSRRADREASSPVAGVSTRSRPSRS